MRQEELKQRKNKIIQLLNGDISEDEGGDGAYEDEAEEEEEEQSIQDEEYVVDDEENQEEIGEETEMFQQRMNVGQFTAEINRGVSMFHITLNR